MKRFGPIISFALIVSFFSACTSPNNTSCRVDPDIFCPLFIDLAAKLSLEEKATLIGVGPENLSKLSWQFKAGVRYDFGLWQDNEITDFFRAQSIDHPETMSGPALIGFIRHLKGERVDMVEVARPYAHPPTPPPPP